MEYEYRGTLESMSVDVMKQDVLVTFAVKASISAAESLYPKLKDKVLKIGWEEYTEQRGMNANAYFHVLCRKIAQHKDIQRTETYVKNDMVAHAGKFELMDNGERWVIKTNRDCEEMWEQETLHTKLLQVREDGTYFYAIMRPTHTLNTKEMAELIDYTVREAKSLDIETMPPAELDHLLSLWKPRKNP